MAFSLQSGIMLLIINYYRVSEMTPEKEARQLIDELLEAAGWHVQDYKHVNLGAGLGVAVREFTLKTGFVDYIIKNGRKH